MKNLKKFLTLGTLAGFLAFLPSCGEKPYEIPDFKYVNGRRIAGNLENPSGLTFNYGSKKSGLQSIEDNSSIFIESPIFYVDGPKIIPEKTINPVVSELSGETENLKIASSDEINIRSLFVDFNSSSYQGLSDSTRRPLGLTLDNLVLKDGSHLLSSNSSNKVFKVNLPNLEVHVQGEEVNRITDMILGTDGKIYAAAVSKINYQDSSLIESPKRVVSIDGNKSINVEFELPSNIHNHPWWIGEPNYPGPWWINSIYSERLKLVENSETGKQKFGAKFYVADLLEDAIYKVDNNNNASVLAKGVRFPNSINVDEAGNVYYTASHLSLNSIEYPTELFALNPETGESRSLYKFNEEDLDISEYFNRDLRLWVKYKGELGMVPLGFNVTSLLSESEKSLDFVFTDSHDGSLISVTVEK